MCVSAVGIQGDVRVSNANWTAGMRLKMFAPSQTSRCMLLPYVWLGQLCCLNGVMLRVYGGA